MACATAAHAGASARVERHIFAPEPNEKGTYKSATALKLEKELMFTGVVQSSQGKWAIIRTRAKTRDEEPSGLRKEGDEIHGMIIKEIGSNYLILAREGKDVRLNLYYEGKSRPAMPIDSASIGVPDDKSPSLPSRASSKPNDMLPGKKPVDPFSQTSGPPVQGRHKKSRTASPVPTPFSQDRSSSEIPPVQFPQDIPPNPFMQGQDTPFNPFQQGQDMPPNPFLDTPPRETKE